ncbi:hypothetical protein B5X24_HaOG201298 [Helicoverpa armigera]|nr:hypothetical protein B5X24_HaOG201298 [Helicoverpa armigera]
MPKRCALGCSNNLSCHRFPHPERNPDRFKAWVHIAGGKLDSPADYELYRKKVLCDIHFTDRDRNRNNRLNFMAVPSLHLPGKFDKVGSSEREFLVPEPLNQESSHAILKPSLTDNSARLISSEHNYCQKKATDKYKKDRLCSLIFDEMSISPQIHYNAAKDQIRGFTFDDKKIADHVLVFMVKGLRKKYKQPVAYYFTNSIKKAELKKILQDVIKYVHSTGLKQICTVCDQSTVNVSVINELVEETRIKYLKEKKDWKHEKIQIGKTEVIPIFDVPHLLKGVRNNILTKDLKYYDFDENCEKIIKWDYFKQVYEADKCYGELKCLLKLTDEHIYVDKMRKMKVKPAVQIFSHSVAMTTGHLVARVGAVQ